jgi:hypothetical protein
MTDTAPQVFEVAQLAGRYRFPSGDGAGQTVGIVTLAAGYDPKPAETYFASRNLEPPVVDVVVIGSGDGPASKDDPTASICVQIVGSIVPKARLVIYQGEGTAEGFVATLVSAARDDERRPSTLLVGYGWADADVSSDVTAPVDDAFAYAASRGTTIICSGGDRVGDGSFFPASSPLVLAVGATAVAADSLGSDTPAPDDEVVWSEDDPSGGAGSFGGQSPRYPHPPWQAGLTAIRTTGEVEEIIGRGIPDVALFGAPRLILNVNGTEQAIGGTIAAAALWTALITLLDQNLGARIGLIAPALYADRRGLTPVTRGDNGVYIATDGWSAGAGLGTPLGDELLTRFRGQSLPFPVPALDGNAPVRNLRRTGYSADDLAGEDALGFSEDADVMATLIAAVDVKPPLSIGLFGNWGSGKSFFMQMLRERIERLANDTRRAEPDVPSDYCEQIVQISFNAWNYVEGNVWAGLVSRVWEALHEHYGRQLDGDERYQRLIAELAGSEASATLLRQELAAKTEVVRSKDDQLKKAENTTVADLAASHEGLKVATDKLVETVGSSAATEKIDELRSDLDDLKTAAGRVKGGWTTLKGPGARRVKLIAASLGLVILAAGIALVVLIDQPVGSTIVGALTIVAAIITPSVALARVAAGAMAAVLRRPEIEDHAQQVAELRTKLQVAEAEAARARTAITEITGTSGVYALVEERYLSSEYREQLGIVGLVQRDMEQLSRQLLPPGPGAPRHGADPDRIVLYIDDLDRCSPLLVTQVLEAIHLLLTYPLFVVVVGVDVRWLSRALETQYAAMLGRGDGDDEPTATPQDYLEKIFQVPLWLLPMEDTAFARLVDGLTAPPAPPPSQTTPGTSPVSSVVLGDAEPETETDATVEHDPVTGQIAGLPPVVPDDLVATALRFSDEERRYLAQLAPLIGTPRVAKRLVNTYRLVRARLDDATAEASYREVLVLLAIVSSFPREAAMLLETLEGDQYATWTEMLTQFQPQLLGSGGGWRAPALPELSEAEAERWSSVCSRLDRVALPGQDLERYRPWIGLIWRHSFIPRPKRQHRAPPAGTGTGQGTR